MKRQDTFVIVLLPVLLGACSSYPQRDVSTRDHIQDTLKQASGAPAPAASAAGALPAAVSQSLLPPLRSTLPHAAARPTEPRFDLSITDAPIAQVLHAIVADTRYSVLLSPKIEAPTHPGEQTEATARAAAATANRHELLTMHLKNVTVLEALDAVRDTYGYEYTVEGTRIYVQPPELQTRFYQINYTLGQRRGVSDLQVIAGASTGSGGNGSGSSSGTGTGSTGSGSSNGSSGSYASTQASALSTIAKSDVWGEIEDSLRTILGCQIPKQQAAVVRATGGGGAAQGGAAGGNAGNSTGAGTRADVSYQGEAQTGERQRGVDGCSDGRAMTLSQMSGTVLVRGMPRELRMVERLLRAMQLNIDRQVSIEAKVIDVQLNKDSQQGINWSAFVNGVQRVGLGSDPTAVGAPGTSTAGVVTPGTSLGQLLGTQILNGAATTAFSSGLGISLQYTRFASLLNFLATQGDVHVLSSPRIATLNNQKAVLKVGAEESFVTSITPGTSALNTGTVVVAAPSLNYQPFFSGIALDVTPQIDEQDRVTLHVHALVNSITEKSKLATPQAGSTYVPFAVNSVSETDSVVKTADGMMVVIGGLMTESVGDNRSRVPVLGSVPVAGAFFRKGEQTSVKRELVILIKPTVVKMDTDWASDIAATQQRIQRMDATAN
jgi:MSHA biogenesis protein MshL